MTADVIDLADHRPQPEIGAGEARLKLIKTCGQNVGHLSAEECRCLAEMLERMGQAQDRPST
jgi:hypothetical protein